MLSSSRGAVSNCRTVFTTTWCCRLRWRYVAEKQYTYVSGKIRFIVLLYEIATGDMLAQIEADYMGDCAPARHPG